MKNLWTFFSFILVVFSLSTLITAGGITQDADGALLIPYAADAPEIDGAIDDIWRNSTATGMFIFENASLDSVASYADHNATFRVMWDEDNLYVLVEVVDDSLDGTYKSEPWNNDCVELFIDGGNEKVNEAYDDNDVQWRWVYGEVPGDTANAGNGPGNFAFLETAKGFNLEVAIPADTISKYFDLEIDTEIGFEISNADCDNVEDNSRDDVLHWWTNDGNTWQYANLFGTALLVENEVSEALNINFTDEAIAVDGEIDDAWIEYASEISMDRFEGTDRPDTILATWKDHNSSFKALWDHDNFYLMVKVTDDVLDGTYKSEPWNNDCIEMFIDGGNEKVFEGYDDNDVQWRWVYGEVPGDTSNASNGPGQFIFNQTEDGYIFEVAIPSDSISKYFDLAVDTEIGFEVSNADCDNIEDNSRDDVRHWWTNDGNTWQYANLFGTALLADEYDIVSVEVTRIDVASDYSLSQNYPNPFNPTTTITYSVANNENVKLAVFDVIGREVAVLVNQTQAAGKYNVEFNATNLSSGVYFYELRTGNQTIVKKMMLLK